MTWPPILPSAMSAVVTPSPRRSIQQESPDHAKTPNFNKSGAEITPTATPIRSRKIVPANPNTCPKAWEQDCNDSKIDKNICNSISHRKRSSLDDEKSVLITSLSGSSEEGSQTFTRDLPEDSNRTPCKYIIVPADIGDERKKFSQYDQLLSPVSTACQSLDDDSISIDIIRNIRRREKEKRPYIKFLCPPYFILAASLLEVSWSSKIISIVEHLSRYTVSLQECELCIFFIFFIKYFEIWNHNFHNKWSHV